MTLTIDDCATNPAQWELLRQLIKSEQVPEDRVAEIAKDHPGFWLMCMETAR